MLKFTQKEVLEIYKDIIKKMYFLWGVDFYDIAFRRHQAAQLFNSLAEQYGYGNHYQFADANDLFGSRHWSTCMQEFGYFEKCDKVGIY